MKNKKICFDKKIGYVILFLFALCAIVIGNTLFLKEKTSYQSKAREITDAKTETPLTSAPLKILDYWLAYKKPTLRAANDQSIKAFAATAVPELNSLTYVGDLKSPEDYPALSTWGCSTTGSTINEPFGIILRELYKDGTDYNNGFTGQSIMSLSFYRNAANELSLVASSWNNSGTIVAMRYFSYQTLLNAFSAVMYEQKGVPMVNESMNVGSCFSANYKRWVKWAQYVINDNGVVNVPANQAPLPTPNPFQERSAYQFQIDTRVKEFMAKFTSIYKTSYPEVVLYPYIAPVKDRIVKVKGKDVQTYIPETLSTMSIPGNYPAPGRAFTKTHPNGDLAKGYDLVHLTYTIDKCGPNGTTGNFNLVKTILEPKWEEYIEQDGTNQREKIDTVTGLNQPLGVTHVMHKRTFINYPLAGVKPEGVTLPECIKNYYDDATSPCPPLSKDIEFEDSNKRDNAFFLTLKPLADSSCKYPLDGTGHTMLDPITLVIYLGD